MPPSHCQRHPHPAPRCRRRPPVAEGKAIHERPVAGGNAVQRPAAGGFFMQATEPARRIRGDLPWLAVVVVTRIGGLGGMNRGVCVGERWRPCCFAGLDSACPQFLQMLESHAAMSSRENEQHRSHARAKEAKYTNTAHTSFICILEVCVSLVHHRVQLIVSRPRCFVASLLRRPCNHIQRVPQIWESQVATPSSHRTRAFPKQV